MLLYHKIHEKREIDRIEKDRQERERKNKEQYDLNIVTAKEFLAKREFKKAKIKLEEALSVLPENRKEINKLKGK